MNPRWPELTATACLLLAGCARFQPHPISPEAGARDFEQRTLADESLHRFAETNLHRALPAWPPPAWNLDTLTLAALYYNPDLAVARRNYDAVAAAKITAGQSPNPTFSVNPVYNTTVAVPSPWLVTANVDVPIETAGKRGYRLARAKHLADAARCAMATAAWDVRARLRRALVELWAAEESEVLLREQADAERVIVEMLVKEMGAGGIAPAEVARERIASERVQLARVDAENRRVQARTQLAAVIGVPVGALGGVVISFEGFDAPPAPLPPSEARRNAMLRRADILGALAEYAASESALRLEIARQYPDIHLNPGYEFDQGSDKWGVGVGFELPVINHNLGPIAEAEGRRQEAAARFNATQARVIGEIETALAGCESADEKYLVANQLLAQARRQEQAAGEMFKAGAVSKQAVVGAKLETANAGVARIDALLQVQLAMAMLEHTLQCRLEPAAFDVSMSPGEKSHP